MNIQSRMLIFCLVIFIPSLQSVKLENLIESLEINKNSLKVTINKTLKNKYLVDDFFIEYDEDIDLNSFDKSIATLPFVLNVLPIIWISGEHYSIESMDEDLFHSLTKIKEVYKGIYPRTGWDGTLTPERLVKNRYEGVTKDPERNLALLFSGGLDSTCSSYYHGDRKQLLITAWGQWDVPLFNEELWKQRKQTFLDHAAKFGHSNSFIRSNYHDFLNWDILNQISPEISAWRVDTTEGLGMMGLAAPILFSRGQTILRIASTYSWAYPYPASACPLVDDLLVFAGGFRLKHDQFDFNRMQKIEFLVKHCKERGFDTPFLKVCDYQRHNNCCDDCSKCIPTILSLLILGEEPKNYGFEISTENAIKRSQKYIVDGQIFFSMWNIACTKERLAELLQKGQSVPSYMLWLLDADLRSNVSYKYVKERQRIHWKKYSHLAAEDLIIPDIAPLELS